MKRLLSLFIFCLLPASSAVCAESQSLYFILDGSGSMWGRVNGQIKMEVAKDVMSELISKTPEGVRSGLTVYGHRKKADCGDIEEVLALSQMDKSDALKRVRAIKPRGKTPIADSLTFVADKLGQTDESSTIVLVSDGIETCNADPCAVAEALRKSGANVRIHVVGFDIRKDEQGELACIAKAGGGRYFGASNADELLAALKTVQKSVVEKQALTEPAAQEPVAAVEEPSPEPEAIVQERTASSSSIRIKAKGPGRISFKHHDWLKKPYAWRLLDPETGKEKGKFKGLETTMVPAGEYQLAWDQFDHGGKEVRLGEVFRVESGETTEVPLLTALQLNLPTWVQKPYYWRLLDPETGDQVAEFRVLEPVIIPPGEYDIVWRQVEHGARPTTIARIQVEPDKHNIVSIATAINPAPADWLQKKVSYWGLKPLDPANNEIVARWTPLEPQLVAPGNYRLVYKLDEHQMSESELGDIEVLAEQMNDIPLNTGVKLVPSTELAAPYRVFFKELDEAGKVVREVKMYKTFGPIMLKPATYQIVYHQVEHGSSPQTIVESFELPKGALVEIDL